MKIHIAVYPYRIVECSAVPEDSRESFLLMSDGHNQVWVHKCCHSRAGRMPQIIAAANVACIANGLSLAGMRFAIQRGLGGKRPSKATAEAQKRTKKLL